MKNYLDDAREEMKRVDHLIYVSLKYTRTVDVIRSIVERIVGALDMIIEGLLEKADKEGKVESIPVSGGVKSNLVKILYKKDSKIMEMIEFHTTLKRIMRAKYSREKEFRRPVKMISDVDGEEVIVDIDKIYEYFEIIKTFLDYIEEKFI